jgi:hypothetical protein
MMAEGRCLPKKKSFETALGKGVDIIKKNSDNWAWPSRSRVERDPFRVQAYQMMDFLDTSRRENGDSGITCFSFTQGMIDYILERYPGLVARGIEEKYPMLAELLGIGSSIS